MVFKKHININKPMVVLTVFLTLFVCLVSFQTSGKEQSAGSLSIAEQIISDLREANQARTTLEKEHAEWQREKAKLELLLKTLDESSKRYKERTQKADSKIEKIRNEPGGMVSVLEEYGRLETIAKSVSGRLNESLDKHSSGSFPGIVPLGEGTREDALKTLESTLKRLNDTEKNVTKWDSGIFSGILERQEIAVRLLRAGDACAWWISLDGKLAGTAKLVDGSLELNKTTDKDVCKQIKSAFLIYSGQLVPKWVALPLEGEN